MDGRLAKRAADGESDNSLVTSSPSALLNQWIYCKFSISRFLYYSILPPCFFLLVLVFISFSSLLYILHFVAKEIMSIYIAL